MAGLSAGLHLAEKGIRPIILESDPQFVGGRLAGKNHIEVNGWNFRQEHGVHGIWSSYLNVQAMLSRNRIRPVLVPAEEETWIYKSGPQKVKRANVGSAIRNSWMPAPFHYLALFLRPRFLAMLDISDWFSLPFVWYGLVFGLGIDPLQEDQPLQGLKLTDLSRRWAPAVRAFITGLARNGLAARPNEVQLAGFIAFLRFYTLLRRDSWAFSYMPEDGGTSMAEPLAKRISELGGIILTGASVSKLDYKDGDWSASWQNINSSQDNSVIYSKQLILAVDSPSASKLLSTCPQTSAVVEDLFWPRGMETAVVRAWFDCSPKPGAEAGILTGDFILHNFFWLHRLQNQYIHWSKITGGSAIEVHIYGPLEILEMDDTLLLSQSLKDIQDAFPELRGHRTHQILQRNPPTHTLFSIGQSTKHLGTITPWPNLYCCGDWIHHKSPAFFLERACVTGIDAANAILESRGITPWPLIQYNEPEKIASAIQVLIRKGRQFRRKRKGLLQKP